MNSNVKINWRWGVIAAFAVTILALYPQLHFWITSGSWESGAYAHVEGVGDEVAYSAYVNALINGRPRLSDPYTGHDERPGQPQPAVRGRLVDVPQAAGARRLCARGAVQRQ